MDITGEWQSLSGHKEQQHVYTVSISDAISDSGSGPILIY